MDDMHHGNHGMHGEIDSFFMPEMASHTAISNGDWSDPNTWEGGRVPDAGADVYIPENITVTYDVNSNTELDFVRVDGMLSWDRTVDTKMVVDTILTKEGSELEIGSMHGPDGSGSATPINADVTAEIVFVDGAIDAGADPGLLTRGLIAWGHVDIMGAEKEPFLSIESGAQSGSRAITVEGDLTNWNVGDTIVLVGTEYVGEDANGSLKSQDEERTIVAIEGNKIIFDSPLQYDHEAPAGYDLDIYVGNSSRNVVFSSENPEGVRGHLMMMNGEVDHGEFANSVLNAQFDDMGRTDKSLPESDANPIGRYPIHLHMIGAGEHAEMSMISGNAVNGSPGWGIVQHDSNAMVNDNFVQDVVGAGIVSEIGTEQGMWVGNLVTSTTGGSHGAGHEGIAYENQSRVLIQQDNIAANSKIGWNWEGDEIFSEKSTVDGIHRKVYERAEIQFDPSPFDVALDHEEPAINHFNGNISIGNDVGFQVFHRQYSDDTDTMSVIKDFTVWGGNDAVLLKNYASNYLFMDSLWIGDGIGLRIERKTSSAVLNNVEMVDFGTGWQSHGVNHEAVLIDVSYTNVGQKFNLKDLMSNVTSDSLRQELIDYYKTNHGIDYTNPMPDVVNSADLTPVERVVFIPDADADLTLAPGATDLDITGVIIDGVGVRNFNEYVIARPPSGSGNSKDFEGIQVNFGGGAAIQRNFRLEEFLELHGTVQKADGSWSVPVINWITDRLTGDQHPVIIEIDVSAFSDEFLEQYKIADWNEPQINNPDFDYGFDVDTGQPTGGGHHGGGDGGHTGGGDGGHTGGGDGGHTGGGDGGHTGGGDGGHTGGGDGGQTGGGDGGQTGGGDGGHTGGGDGGQTGGGDGGQTGGGTEPELETINGTNGSDKLLGTADNEHLVGGAGSDTLRAYGGDDVLEGGTGKDVLEGGTGADRFVINTLDGTFDIIKDFSITQGDILDLSAVLSGFSDGSTVGDFVQIIGDSKRTYLQVNADGQGDDFVTVARIINAPTMNVETLYQSGALDLLTNGTPAGSGDGSTGAGTGGGTSDDTGGGTGGSTGGNTDGSGPIDSNLPEIRGTDGSNTIEGSGKAEQILGLGGNDILRGKAGDDVIQGGNGKDKLYGNAGNDTLVGGNGDDSLMGSSGNDHLIGGAGSDALVGGSGADSFEFRADDIGQGMDRIRDFSLADGDQIVLADLIASGNAPAADVVKLTQQGGSTIVSVDIDGAANGQNFVDLFEIEDQRITLDQLLGNDALSY